MSKLNIIGYNTKIMALNLMLLKWVDKQCGNHPVTNRQTGRGEVWKYQKVPLSLTISTV